MHTHHAVKMVLMMIIGNSNLVRFTPIWSDLVIRVTHVRILIVNITYTIEFYLFRYLIYLLIHFIYLAELFGLFPRSSYCDRVMQY